MVVDSLARIGIAAIASALFVAGCATVPPPREQIAVAKSAITDASSAGAARLAPTAYASAQSKLDLAQAAMRAGDYGRARMLAEDAEADAKVAAARARSDSAQRAADEVRAGIRALEDETTRNAR